MWNWNWNEYGNWNANSPEVRCTTSTRVHDVVPLGDHRRARPRATVDGSSSFERSGPRRHPRSSARGWIELDRPAPPTVDSPTLERPWDRARSSGAAHGRQPRVSPDES